MTISARIGTWSVAIVLAVSALAWGTGAVAAVDHTGTRYETASGATYYAPDDVPAGGTIRLSGEGWTVQDGSRGSVIVVKMDVRTNADTPTKTTREVVDPTTGQVAADKSIHAIVEADFDGSWEVEVPVPTAANSDAGWTSGQTRHVRLLTGSMRSGDIARSGGADIVVTEQAATSCVPSTPAATVSVAQTASFGGAITVTGTGWCHPTDGASTVAVKIDDGAYERTDSTVNSNKSIWAIINPDPATGDFATTITLPDGTAATSSPALASGAHFLRFLSGSLKESDTVRTVKSGEFVVGSYRPNGVPDPVDAAELTAANRGGLKVTKKSKSVVVTIPGTSRGDWVYLNVLDGASPRAPWGQTWFRVGANHRVTASLTGITLPTGTTTLTAQSGNSGQVGKLLGWGKLKVKATSTSTKSTTSTSSGSSTSSSSSGSSSGAVASPVPDTPPAAPVESGAKLTSKNAGEVSSVLDDGILTVTVPQAAPQSWIYAYLYGDDANASLGWIQLDDEGTFQVDVAALGEGRFKVAVLDPAGELLGWTGWGSAVEPAAAQESTALSQAPVAQVSGGGGTSMPDGFLDVVLGGLGLVALAGSTAALAVGRSRRAPVQAVAA